MTIRKSLTIFFGLHFSILMLIGAVTYIFGYDIAATSKGVAIPMLCALYVCHFYIKHLNRTPTKKEANVLGLFSVLASLASSVLATLILTFIMYGSESVAVIDENLSELPFTILGGFAVFFILIGYGVLFFTYSYLSKIVFKKKLAELEI